MGASLWGGTGEPSKEASGVNFNTLADQIQYILNNYIKKEKVYPESVYYNITDIDDYTNKYISTSNNTLTNYTYGIFTNYIDVSQYRYIICTLYSNRDCYGLALYDKNKNFIPELSVSVASQGAIFKNIAIELESNEYINVKYIRWFVYTGSNNYDTTISKRLNLFLIGNTNYNKINANKKYLFGIYSDNSIYTPQSTNNTVYVASSGFIPFDNNVIKSIYYSTFINNTYYRLAFFDSDFILNTELSILGDTYGATRKSETIDTSGSDYDNIKFMILTSWTDADNLSNEYLIINPTEEDQQQEPVYDSPLYGKMINFMGDSITSIDYTRPNYWEQIAADTGCTVNNYGQSGTTLAHTDSRHLWDYAFAKEDAQELGYDPSDPNTWETGNCFVERVDEMNPDADAVVVMGGTNDGGVPRGSYNSTDISTFFGALNILIQRLLETFKGKPIIICTMMQNTTAYSSNVADPRSALLALTDSQTLTLQLRAEAIKVKCAQYGIDCLDLYNSSGINGVDSNNIYFRNNDSLHPSAIGQLRLKNLIQKELEKFF